VTSGSAALPVSLAQRWQSFAGAIPLERYGMTEIGIGLSNALEVARRKPGFVGAPLESVEIRIVHDDGSDGDGPGDLWVRGPGVFAGYFDRPEATEESFRDGWFVTGDVAIRDADGDVRLLGRKSADILKTGGEKVSALEIEEVLREYAAFSEVAVVGVPDATWGDRVVAAVVVRPGSLPDATTERVRAWAKERLSPYKIPREVIVLEALPKNAMGKVQKGEIVALLVARGRPE
jgi:malonyl-CoA/methylmalonyl-CoA synthetase